jgi:hypothetical protein
LLVDFYLEAVSIQLAIWQRSRLLKEGIVDSSRDADAALLRKGDTGR